MDDLTKTGKRIRQLRLEKGWSQAKLGKEVGLNGRSVRDWETRCFTAVVENAQEAICFAEHLC